MTKRFKKWLNQSTSNQQSNMHGFVVLLFLFAASVTVFALDRQNTVDTKKFQNQNVPDTQQQAAMSEALPIYQIVDEGGTNQWIRWQSVDTNNVFIKQISTSGTTTTVTFVNGLWTNRLNLAFGAIND